MNLYMTMYYIVCYIMFLKGPSCWRYFRQRFILTPVPPRHTERTLAWGTPADFWSIFTDHKGQTPPGWKANPDNPYIDMLSYAFICHIPCVTFLGVQQSGHELKSRARSRVNQLRSKVSFQNLRALHQSSTQKALSNCIVWHVVTPRWCKGFFESGARRVLKTLSLFCE